MRRVIIILIIIVLFLLSTSCSLTNTCSKNDNYKIDYYSGGGFTGIESGVTINCNGEVRFWERKPNTNSTTIDSLRLNDKQIIEFNKMLENPELFVYKNILKKMQMVAEGVETCRSVCQLSKKYKIETPIANAVYKVLFEERDPVKVTYELMSRDMKAEDE